MATHTSGQVLLVVGGVVTCASIGILALRAVRWRRHATARWTVIPAKLVEFEFKDVRHIYGQPFKVAQVWYKYKMGGATFGSSHFSLFHNAMGWSPALSDQLLLAAAATSAAFSGEKTVNAYVDERHPARSVLVTDVPMKDLIDFFGPPILLLVFGLALLLLRSWW